MPLLPGPRGETPGCSGGCSTGPQNQAAARLGCSGEGPAHWAAASTVGCRRRRRRAPACSGVAAAEAVQIALLCDAGDEEEAGCAPRAAASCARRCLALLGGYRQSGQGMRRFSFFSTAAASSRPVKICRTPWARYCSRSNAAMQMPPLFPAAPSGGEFSYIIPQMCPLCTAKGHGSKNFPPKPRLPGGGGKKNFHRKFCIETRIVWEGPKGLC